MCLDKIEERENRVPSRSMAPLHQVLLCGGVGRCDRKAEKGARCVSVQFTLEAARTAKDTDARS